MRLLGLSPHGVASPAMRAIFADRATLQAMLDVEAALVRAAVKCGIAPASAAEVIAAAADASLYDTGLLADEALRAGTPAIPIVAALVAEVRRRAPDAASWVHSGATSQDIVDTAMAIQLQAAAVLIENDGARLARGLADLARNHAETPMLGRTLLQPGPPITFGLKAAGWLDQLARSLARVRQAAASAAVLQFGGAVGTLAALEGRGLEMTEALGQLLRLQLPVLPWHAARDRTVALGLAVAILGGGLGKIARDLTLLAQAEVSEAFEPGGAGRGGSSTMPHKRNPIASVVALATAQRLPGLAATLVAGLVQEHERATGGWQAEGAVLAEIMLAVSGALAALIEAIEGLHVDAASMGANIEMLDGLVFAERLAMALAPGLGRDGGHALVERLVQEAIAERVHLHDVARRHPAVQEKIGLERLDQLFHIAGATGHAGEFVARVLNAQLNLQQENPDALHIQQ